MTRTRVALATCSELPHLDADDAPLRDALLARAIEPVLLPWDGDPAAFLSCAATVIRSTWDYTQRVDDFVRWARGLDAAGHPLWNPADVVAWNTHKRYLLELARAGVGVVPTALWERGAALDVRAELQRRGWTRGAVLKPAVSAGARDTLRVHDLDSVDVDAAQALATRLLATRDVLLQPYVPGIDAGEVSLIFVEGEYSHAVNKRPRAADFRSQPEFGSRVEACTPSSSMQGAAQAALAAAARSLARDDDAHGPLLYARVDLVEGEGGAPWLMELELVEPSLYLRYDGRAAERLADAIARRLDAPAAAGTTGRPSR